MHKGFVVILTALLVSRATAVAVWGQCGGLNYTGSTTCDSGLTCVYVNDYYYQCQTGSGTGGGTTTTTTTTATSNPTSALKTLASAKGRYIGTAYDYTYMSDTAYSNIVTSQFNSLTPENSMKWDATEASRGTFTFTNADKVVAVAAANGMKMRGHTLVWHSQLPTWVSGGGFNNATLISIMENHITTIMTHYKGQIYSWDVVNECLNEDGSLRTSVFYTTIGEYFIDIAFKTARAADSNAILGINDYNLDTPGTKSTGMLNLVNRLLARGVPIDQIGIQGHLITGSVPSSILTNWQAFAKVIKYIAITELDIKMTTTNLAQQATDYTTVVDACLSISNCIGITVWGASDKYSWITDGAPCLYDSNLAPKPAYTAVVKALGG